MVEREVQKDGLTFLFQNVPGVRSASIGVWLRLGSRNEPHRLSGICHFIEHLLFKGTQNRSARDISLLTDRIGGNVDAFTAKEETCFYARVLDEHIPLAVDLLADIVRRPLFESEELERERKVILEEIRMVLDSPEDRVYDLFCESFWPGHPLGRPIQGTAESVGRMSRSSVLRWFRRAYVPPNIVVAAAGHLTRKHKDLIRQAFSGLPNGERVPPGPPPRWRAGIQIEDRKQMEQLHLLVGLPALPAGHEDRFALHLLNTVLGASISSRLFRRIREERGLAYAVSSHIQSHHGGGLWTIYAATSPQTAREVLKLALEEMTDLAAHAPTVEELEVARDHLKGNLLLALESTSSRMSRAVREELVLGRGMTTEEIVERLEAVTPFDLQSVAARLLGRGGLSLAAVGRMNRLRLSDADLFR